MLHSFFHNFFLIIEEPPSTLVDKPPQLLETLEQNMYSIKPSILNHDQWQYLDIKS